jgi:hypothetical protein
VLLKPNSSYSQQLNAMESFNFIDSDLLKKSRRQKTFGWIMIGLGLPVTALSTYVSIKLRYDIGDDLHPLIALGGLTTIGGIFLVSAGVKNKKKALSIGFNNIPVQLPSFTKVNYRLQPAFVVRIPLQ